MVFLNSFGLSWFPISRKKCQLKQQSANMLVLCLDIIFPFKKHLFSCVDFFFPASLPGCT